MTKYSRVNKSIREIDLEISNIMGTIKSNPLLAISSGASKKIAALQKKKQEIQKWKKEEHKQDMLLVDTAIAQYNAITNFKGVF